MTEEFNLSEKSEIRNTIRLAVFGAGSTAEYTTQAEDIIIEVIERKEREFIRRLKELIDKELIERYDGEEHTCMPLHLSDLIAFKEEIDTLAGKELSGELDYQKEASYSEYHRNDGEQK